MIAKDILEISSSSILLEVYNRAGYETTYKVDPGEIHLLDSKLLNATVKHISVSKGCILLDVFVRESNEE